MTPSGYDDHELMAQVARGDREALGRLYDRYGRAVYAMARGMLQDGPLAEEVTQDVFTTLWLKASTYQPERGRVYSWLMTIAHNRVLDELRRVRRAQRVTVPGDGEGDISAVAAARDVPTEAEIVQRLDNGRVRDALQALPEEQRRVVVMAYYQGYSHTEIAGLLSQPLGTVKTRMRLALQKLRAVLEHGQ